MHRPAAPDLPDRVAVLEDTVCLPLAQRQKSHDPRGLCLRSLTFGVGSEPIGQKTPELPQIRKQARTRRDNDSLEAQAKLEDFRPAFARIAGDSRHVLEAIQQQCPILALGLFDLRKLLGSLGIS